MICGSVTVAMAQNTSPWPSTGNVGIGLATANFHLQLHGTTDYSVTFPATPPVYDIYGNVVTPAQIGYTVNYGKSSRLGLTNSVTGTTNLDGMQLRMSGNNFVMENQENQDISVKSGGVNMLYSGSSNRIWCGAGFGTQTASDKGYLNIVTSDNGLYIKTNAASRFGLSVTTQNLTDNAIQVMGTTGTTRNFSVKSNGEVYARKFTTTLSNIPDYVFQPDYQLMPFPELRAYLIVNHHLPNVPSANEYAETGVDLGELNRLLLEKTEELTLYILQLEERIRLLEEAKN